MIINLEDSFIFHKCPFHTMDEHKDDNSKIPRFYSQQHAIDSGWVKTSYKKFLTPGEKSIWLCPECSKKHFTKD